MSSSSYCIPSALAEIPRDPVGCERNGCEVISIMNIDEMSSVKESFLFIQLWISCVVHEYFMSGFGRAVKLEVT